MENLFTVRQVSQSCGISRATILRLEEKGLLKPAFIDGKSGYRYYDNHNVSQIMQIQLFLGMGMSYDDILLYYRGDGASPQLLKQVEMRFYTLKRAYDEIRLRMEGSDAPTFSWITLPEYVCFSREFRGATAKEQYWAMYQLYHEAVERGYRLLPSEPLFIVSRRDDFLRGAFSEKEIEFTCCIPLQPDDAPEDAVVYPRCRAFSCLYRGDYSQRKAVFDAFGQKIRELNLQPLGDVRTLGVVAPYTGRNIPASSYVTRLAVPVDGQAPETILLA